MRRQVAKMDKFRTPKEGAEQMYEHYRSTSPIAKKRLRNDFS